MKKSEINEIISNAVDSLERLLSDFTESVKEIKSSLERIPYPEDEEWEDDKKEEESK